MTHRDVEPLVNKIQAYSEAFHCASAVMAYETSIQAESRRKKESMVSAYLKLIESVDENNEEIVSFIVENINALKKTLKTNVRVRLCYDNVDKGARRIEEKDGSTMVFIVLPKEKQKIIFDGIKNNGVWTDDMKKAKDFLRFKTAHEMWHILTNNNEEPLANEFSSQLIKKRKERAQILNT